MVGTHYVQGETLVRRITHFLYEYNILKNELSDHSYQLLVWGLDSIEPPGCRSMYRGSNKEGRRDGKGGS